MIVDERMTAYIRSLDTGESELIREIAKQAREDRVPIIRQETASLLRVLIKMTKPKKILEVGTAVGFSALLMSEYAPSDARVTTIEKFQKRIDEAKLNFERAGVGEKVTLLEGDAIDILKQLEDSYDFIFMDAAKGQYIHFLPGEKVTLLEGDAIDILKQLEDSYDFIFMDAAKGQYIHFLPEVMRLLKDGGTLVSDNVLQDGDIIESRYAVTRRNRTIHSRMRDYLWELTHRADLQGGTLVSDNVLQDGDIIESRYAVTRRNRTIHSRMRDYLWELTHRADLQTVILPIGDGVTISTKI